MKMDERRKAIGAQIRAARDLKGWKQKELARRVSVEPQTVSNWERGITLPDMELLAIVARETDQEIAFFVRDAATQRAEAASVGEIADMMRKLVEDVGQLRSGQDEIGQRIGRLEARESEATG